MKLLFTFALACVLGFTASAADPALLIPDSATSVVLIRTEDFRASPMVANAEANGHHLLADAEGSQWLMLASDLDVHFVQPSYRVFAARFEEPQEFVAQVKEEEGAVHDRLAERPSMWIGQRACVVAFTPHLFGGIGPISRQQATRWVDDVVRGEEPGAAYLKNAIRAAEEEGDELVLALDVHEMFRPQEIEAAVQRSGLYPPDAIAAVTDAFDQIHGATLRVNVGEKATGHLQLDFQSDASPLHPYAKETIRKLMSAAGTLIPDLAKWETTNGPHSIAIHGPLSLDGLQRVVSIMELDGRLIDRVVDPRQQDGSATASTGQAEGSEEAAVDASEATARRRTIATKRYFSRLDSMISTLRWGAESDLHSIALWLERDADHIDRLSTHNVDSELVAFGQGLARQMRTMAGILSGLSREIASKRSETVSQVQVGMLPTRRTVNRGGYRYRRYVPFATVQMDVGAATRAAQEAERTASAGVEEVRQIATQQIADFHALGRRLEERYGTSFAQ